MTDTRADDLLEAHDAANGTTPDPDHIAGPEDIARAVYELIESHLAPVRDRVTALESAVAELRGAAPPR